MNVVALMVLATQGPTISLEADAIRVDALLKAVASETGQKFDCGPEVAAEPVVVQFHRQPLAEVMDRLAKVLDAEWTDKDGVRRLVRPAALRQKQEAEESNQIRESLASLLKDLKAEFRRLPILDAKEAERFVDPMKNAGPTGFDQKEYAYIQSANPVTRAAVGLIQAIGVQRLTSMYLGERTVYSNSPNVVQRPFPGASGAILTQLRKDGETLVAAKARIEDHQRPRMRIGGFLEVGPGILEGGIGKTIFSVQRRSSLRFSFTLTMIDREAKVILRGSGDVPDRSRQLAGVHTNKGEPLTFSKNLMTMAFLRKNLGYAAAGGPVAKLDDGTRIRASFGVSFAESEGRAPDLGLGDLLEDPVARDPLALSFGPLMRQVAEKQGKPLLATISDGSIVALLEGLNFQSIKTHSDLFEFLDQTHVPAGARNPNAQRMDDSEWLLFKPAFPAAARKGRFDREAMRSLIKSMKEKQTITLEDATAYGKRAPVMPSFAGLDMMYMRSAVPTIDRQIPEQIFGAALSFLSEMGPDQFRRLSNEGTPYSDLAPKQKETLRRWLYDDFTRTRPEPDDGPPMPFRGPLESEPTEVFPNGFPAPTLIRVDLVQADAVIARATTGYHYCLNLDSLAYHDTMGAEGEFLGAKFSRNYVGFRPALQSLYSVIAHFGEKGEIRQSIQETRPVEGGKEITRDQFPESYRKRMERAKAAFSRPAARAGGPPPKMTEVLARPS